MTGSRDCGIIVFVRGMSPAKQKRIKTMDLEDVCNRFALEYAQENSLGDIKTMDDLKKYDKAKVALLVKNYLIATENQLKKIFD